MAGARAYCVVFIGVLMRGYFDLCTARARVCTSMQIPGAEDS